MLILVIGHFYVDFPSQLPWTVRSARRRSMDSPCQLSQKRRTPGPNATNSLPGGPTLSKNVLKISFVSSRRMVL